MGRSPRPAFRFRRRRRFPRLSPCAPRDGKTRPSAGRKRFCFRRRRSFPSSPGRVPGCGVSAALHNSPLHSDTHFLGRHPEAPRFHPRAEGSHVERSGWRDPFDFRLRAGSSLRLKNSRAQDDVPARKIVKAQTETLVRKSLHLNPSRLWDNLARNQSAPAHARSRKH